MAPAAKSDAELMDLLKEFNTPSIANAVASNPADGKTCLGLYDPWAIHWYTDSSVRCMFPELGSLVGHAVTVVYGPPNERYDRLRFADVLRAIDETDRPAILCVRQDFPDGMKDKNGFPGGDMVSALKTLGCVGLISDGPACDVDEVRRMNFQYLLPGITPGHGPNQIKAVNVPVHICGMDVCPGEIIHMDENGAVKFPRSRLRDVYDRVLALQDHENRRKAAFASADDLDKVLRIWEK